MVIIHSGIMALWGIRGVKNNMTKKESINKNWTEIGVVNGPDPQNRIVITPIVTWLKQHIDSFKVFINSSGNVLLQPMVSLPLEEAWPYQSPQILSNVLKGIEEAKAGKAKPFNLKELDDV